MNNLFCHSPLVHDVMVLEVVREVYAEGSDPGAIGITRDHQQPHIRPNRPVAVEIEIGATTDTGDEVVEDALRCGDVGHP